MTTKIIAAALLLAAIPLAASAGTVDIMGPEVGRLCAAERAAGVTPSPTCQQREAWSNWAGGGGNALDDVGSSVHAQLAEQETQRTSSDPIVRKHYMCNGAGTIVIGIAEDRDAGKRVEQARDKAVDYWHAPVKLAGDLAKVVYKDREAAPMALGKAAADACESKPNFQAQFEFLLK